jgi:hypothetical protein
MGRWHATYHWKALDKGYNFASNHTSIKGLHTKLWASKVAGDPIIGISGLPSASPGTKWHLGANPMAKHIVYYKGGRWWLPPSSNHVEFCESVFVRGSFMHQRCSNYTLSSLLFGLCRSMWVLDLLVNLLSPNLEALTRPFTLKCCEPRNVPQFLLFGK